MRHKCMNQVFVCFFNSILHTLEDIYWKHLEGFLYVVGLLYTFIAMYFNSDIHFRLYAVARIGVSCHLP